MNRPFLQNNSVEQPTTGNLATKEKYSSLDVVVEAVRNKHKDILDTVVLAKAYRLQHKGVLENHVLDFLTTKVNAVLEGVR